MGADAAAKQREAFLDSRGVGNKFRRPLSLFALCAGHGWVFAGFVVNMTKLLTQGRYFSLNLSIIKHCLNGENTVNCKSRRQMTNFVRETRNFA